MLLWLTLFSAVVLPFFVLRKAAGFVLVAGFTLLVLASLVYLSRGYVKVASWIFLSCMWSIVTIILILTGGITSLGVMSYLATSITAACLLGEREAFISAGLLVAVALTIALLEFAGVAFRRDLSASSMAAWMLVVLLTAIGILPVTQVLRSLSEALKRTRETVEDLKRREMALQESDDRCRLALETGRMFAFEWNPETDEVRRSADCTEILGVNGDPTRESGRSSLQRIHPEDQEGLIQAYRTLTPTKDSYKIEYRVIHSSGRVVRVQQNARALFDGDGRMLRLVGITADITERKQAEEALRESEERFRGVFEEGPLGLALVGKDYRFLKVNGALCQMVGYPEASLLQMTFADITHPDDLRADEELADRLFSGEIPYYRLRKRYVTKSGEIIWIDLTGSVIRDKKGEVMYGLAMIEDMTERMRAEEAVKRAHDIEIQLASDLATSRDEIRALAASLMKAHEDERRRVSRELHDQICHQLASLAIDIGNLAVSPLPPENLRAHLTAIRARVVKTSQETHDIAYQMHTAILDDLGLVASLNALCRQFSEQYPNVAVDFKNSGPPTSIPNEVATCIYRVAQESLQNMAKHSGAENVSVRLGFTKEAVVLTIQDDGVGFDPKSVKGHGGIGLISMKERAHLVKGKLNITAQLGQGTQVSLEVPLPAGHS